MRNVLLFTNPLGETQPIEVSGNQHFNLPMLGTYNLSYSVQDNHGDWSEAVEKSVEIVNKFPIANFEISQISVDRYFFVVQNSYDLDGYIMEYNFKFNGPNGEILTNTSSSNFEIQLANAGSWNISLIVKDNEDGESITALKNILIENQLPSANFLVELREDGKGANINATGNDPEGTAITYLVKAIDIENVESSYSFNSDNFSIDLNKPGLWRIQLSVKDTEGGESQVSEFSLDIEDFIPIADFTISNSNGAYTLDASGSIDDYEVTSYEFKVTSPDFVETIYNQKVVNNLLLNRDGEWKFSLIVKDNKNQESIEIVKTEFVDTLPSDPGEAGKATLAGVDSDGDGVRDDIELIINSYSIAEVKKSVLKEFSRKLQETLINATSIERSIAATKERIEYDYCIDYSMTNEEKETYIHEIVFEYFNTKDRVLGLAQSQQNFGGQMAILDTNEENYNNYCNK